MLYPCTTLLPRSITTEPIVDQGKPSHKDTYEYTESATILHFNVLNTIRSSAEFGWEPLTLFEVPAPTNFVSGSSFTVTGATGSSETKWYKIISRRLIPLQPISSYLKEKSGEQEGLASKDTSSIRSCYSEELHPRHFYCLTYLDNKLHAVGDTITHICPGTVLPKDKVLSPEVRSPAAQEVFSRDAMRVIIKQFIDFVNSNSAYRATLAASKSSRDELTKILQHFFNNNCCIRDNGWADYS